MLQNLHNDERAQIKARNDNFIAQIRTVANDGVNIEAKVMAMCNCAGRIFMNKRQWLMANPHNLETVEAVLTEEWIKIRGQTNADMRKAMLDRCVTNASEELKNEFYHYANGVLPM